MSLPGGQAYRVFIGESATREIRSISNRRDRQRILARIGGLSTNPRPPGCVKLAAGGGWRIRQGRYRIVYTLDDDTVTVIVVKVGDRKSVYRRKD
jgi:mRNA interferase RelE/StbE